MVVVSSLSGFRIPVTGGAGFIAGHVADRLAGIDTVFDHPVFGRADLISRHPENGVGI